MKKILVVVLALVMALSLVACGGKTDSEGGSTAPAETAESAKPETTAADVEATQGEDETEAPTEAALLPGVLFQLDAENPVVRGLTLAGNRSGTEAFNTVSPAAEGVRCIFELNEWVEVTPDTAAEDGLALWVFRHREDPAAYGSASLSEEAEGFAAYCELPFDPDAEPGASRGSFYLNPDDCEEGYYDLVFTSNGNATAVLLARFYAEGELADKTDDELMQIMTGLE